MLKTGEGTCYGKKRPPNLQENNGKKFSCTDISSNIKAEIY